MTTLTPARHLLLEVDAHRYSGRSLPVQQDLQAALHNALDDAAEASGLARIAWQKQPKGDSELSVLPRDQDEPVVVGDFVRNLFRALNDYNTGKAHDRILRIRLALHFGLTHPADLGYSGPGVVELNRLLNSNPVRNALRLCPGSPLAVILSHQLYLDTVAQDLTSLATTDFRKVEVRNKEYDGIGWLYVPGVNPDDLGGVQLTPEPDPEPPAPLIGRAPASSRPAGRKRGQATYETTIKGDVKKNGRVVFGPNYELGGGTRGDD